MRKQLLQFAKMLLTTTSFTHTLIR